MQTKSLHDGRPVKFSCADRNIELSRDIFGAAAGCNELQYLSLPSGKPGSLCIRIDDSGAGSLFGKKRSAPKYGVQRGKQLLSRYSLGEISLGANPGRLFGIGRLRAHGKKDN